jgi:predicted oxidoreductase
MQTISIGVSSLQCSRLAYGCWRVAGAKKPGDVTPELRIAAKKALTTAFESGYTMFDAADIYCAGEAERILGEVLREVQGMHKNVLVVTKCGVRHRGEPRPDSPERYDLSADYIVASCEASLKRLGREQVDLFLLHRQDYLCDPAEVASAFSRLREAGKVRYFGASNFRPTMLTAIQAACPMPLIAHQVEISLARLAPFHDGTLDQCLIERITPMAWSPLGGGLLADGAKRLLPAQQKYQTGAIVTALDTIAAARGVSRMVVAMAWLLKHPSRIQPVVGSVNPAHIREAVAATEFEMSRDEWYTLLNAALPEPIP